MTENSSDPDCEPLLGWNYCPSGFVSSELKFPESAAPVSLRSLAKPLLEARIGPFDREEVVTRR